MLTAIVLRYSWKRKQLSPQFVLCPKDKIHCPQLLWLGRLMCLIVYLKSVVRDVEHGETFEPRHDSRQVDEL